MHTVSVFFGDYPLPEDPFAIPMTDRSERIIITKRHRDFDGLKMIFPFASAKLNLESWPIFLIYVATIFLEAESEPYAGKLGIGYVIYRRANATHRSYATICLAPQQFSCWNTDAQLHSRDRLMQPNDFAWELSWKAACSVHWGFEPDPTDGATKYLDEELTRQIRPDHDLPSWVEAMTKTIEIGKHSFYK